MRRGWGFPSFSIILPKTLLNILLLMKAGFEVSLSSFFSLVTSLTSTCLPKFFIVFPKTPLFISLKKSFSNEFLACFSFLSVEDNILLKPRGLIEF